MQSSQASQDYTELKKVHHELMRAAGCSIEELTALRQDIHKHAEGKYEEVRTSGLIVE